MKVAIYTGGIHAPTFIQRLIVGLADEGIDVLVFGPENGPPPTAHKHIHVFAVKRDFAGDIQFVFRFLYAVIFHRSRLLRYYSNVRKEWPWSSTAAWKKWRKHISVLINMPDIFHMQWAFATEDWFFLKEHFNVKFIISLRGAHINYSPLFDSRLASNYKRCFPLTDSFHAVSKAIGREAVLYGAPENKIKVIYSGLPLHDFSFNNLPKLKQNATVKIISVGRAHWKKGYRYAIDAIYLLKQKGYNIKYTIIGGLATEHVHHIAQLNLQDNISIKQRVPFEEVRKNMIESDILLLPSVEEGIANVVLEAMALGTLVVSSDCGGMEEVIKHQVSGFVFPLRNVDRMVDCLEKAIEIDSEERLRMIKNARQRIESHHTANLLVSEMIQLYQTA